MPELGATNSRTSFSIPVVLSAQNPTGSTAVGTETDLATYTMPANTLGVNFDSIEITGLFDIQSNLATARVYFGGTAYLSLGSLTAPDIIFFCIRILRTTSSTAQLLSTYYLDRTGQSVARGDVVSYTNIAKDLATNLVIKTTGQGPIGNDIYCPDFKIVKYPAP